MYERTAWSRRALVATFADLEPDALVSAVVEHSTPAIARLQGGDWESMARRVRAADGSYPGRFAWRCGYAHHHLGHTIEALHYFEKADRGDLSDSELAHLAAAESSAAWIRGERARCSELADTALTCAEASGDRTALASAWVCHGLLRSLDGDRQGSAQAYGQALDHAEAGGEPLTLVRVHNNLAVREIEEGRYLEARERIQVALRINEDTGHLPGLALLRHNLARALHGLGRLDEALLEAEASRAIWLDLDSSLSGMAWQLIGEVQSSRGNLAQAMIAFREAVRLAESDGNTHHLVPALAGLAITHVADDPEASLEIVERLLGEPSTTGHIPGVLAAGWVHLHAGDPQRALVYATEAAAEAGRRHDLARLGEALELSVLASTRDPNDARLREAQSIWESVGNVVRRQVNRVVSAHLEGRVLAEQVARQELRSLGVHDDAWGIAGALRDVRLSTDDARARVHALGTFVVLRDGVPVSASAWPSRKARDVLKILAGRGERGITRDQLGDLLWPDSTELGNRISIALSQLRSLLDPDKEHPGDWYIQADRTSVRLHPVHVACDVTAFRAATSEALDAFRHDSPQAVPMLEAAAAMHTGKYVADDAYEDWAVEVREELDALGQELNRTLAQALSTGTDPDRAVPWLVRLLSVDPYDEPTYEELIRLLHDRRRHGEARRYYRTYVLRMRELGTPPTPWEEFLA